MKWILDNLWTLLIIAGVLAQLIQAIKGKKEGENAPEAPPPLAEFEDAEMSERTRKIREDIQRKIEQRHRDSSALPPMAPERTASAPVEPTPFAPEYQRTFEPEPVSLRALAEERMEARRAAEILEQQVALADRLRHVELVKASAVRRATFEEGTIAASSIARKQNRAALLGDLRDPAALRRAFVLREVLGPPLSIR
ncbi:MAG: hypothetical protein Q8M02_00425 [Candidatus Didemnitutus sp.]|nr:hypothetical protein [Candidatus Didemnitutus sp.]